MGKGIKKYIQVANKMKPRKILVWKERGKEDKWRNKGRKYGRKIGGN